MVRSYAVTFTFILIRLPNAFPFWTHLGDTLYAIRIILLTLLAVFIPDFVFIWQELRQPPRLRSSSGYSLMVIWSGDFTVYSGNPTLITTNPYFETNLG